MNDGKINRERLTEIIDQSRDWSLRPEFHSLSVRQLCEAAMGGDPVLTAWEVGWCLGGLTCTCCKTQCECGCRLTCPAWGLVVREMARRELARGVKGHHEDV